MSWIAEKLAWLLGIAAAIGGFFLYAKRQGKKDEQAVETEKSLQQAKEANDTDTRVRNMSDSQLDEQLRSVQRKGGVLLDPRDNGKS